MVLVLLEWCKIAKTDTRYANAESFAERDRFTLVVAFGARGFIGERLLYSVVGASGPVGDLSNRRQEILVK